MFILRQGKLIIIIMIIIIVIITIVFMFMIERAALSGVSVLSVQSQLLRDGRDAAC
jgi:hypothetical protein